MTGTWHSRHAQIYADGYVMSMCLLPAFGIPIIWNVLQVPPVCSADFHTRAQALAQYFQNTWIAGEFPPSMWTHFDHCGPRTTNLAEGFHNSLNSGFGTPHPSMRTFLDWLQKCQFERNAEKRSWQPVDVQNNVHQLTSEMMLRLLQRSCDTA